MSKLEATIEEFREALEELYAKLPRTLEYFLLLLERLAVSK